MGLPVSTRLPHFNPICPHLPNHLCKITSGQTSQCLQNLLH